MADRVYCVHGGEVVSQTDGDRHFIPSPRVAALFELGPTEWYPAPRVGFHRDYGKCLRPSYSGRYGREALPQ